MINETIKYYELNKSNMSSNSINFVKQDIGCDFEDVKQEKDSLDSRVENIVVR